MGAGTDVAILDGKGGSVILPGGVFVTACEGAMAGLAWMSQADKVRDITRSSRKIFRSRRLASWDRFMGSGFSKGSVTKDEMGVIPGILSGNRAYLARKVFSTVSNLPNRVVRSNSTTVPGV